jgi:hypothetical protein
LRDGKLCDGFLFLNKNTRVVDKDVDTAEDFHGPRHRSAHLFFFGHISFYKMDITRPAQFVFRFPACLDIKLEEDNFHPRGEKTPGDCLPYPLPSTGNYGGSSF